MLERIVYLQEIVRCGNFTEAAENCHMSQSAISQQIKALERELGVTLIERKGRSFMLTPAGEYLNRKSEPLLAAFDKLVKETQAIEHQDAACVRVGILRDYTGNEVQLAVAAFSEKYPDVELSIRRGNHEEIYRWLHAEEIDMAMSDQRRAFSQNYINTSLIRRPVYVEIAARNPLSGAERLTGSELQDLPMILVTAPGEEETEKAYYREIIGFAGDFLIAESLEQGRLMVLRDRGFMPVESAEMGETFETAVRRIPFMIGDGQMTKHYCVFYKNDNAGYYIEEFADMLKVQFL